MTQGPQTQDLLLAQVGFNKQPTQDMDDVEEHVPTQGPLAMSPAAQVDQLQQLLAAAEQGYRAQPNVNVRPSPYSDPGVSATGSGFRTTGPI